MTSSDRPSDGSNPHTSLTEAPSQSWTWLDALGRSFGCAILLVTPDGDLGPLVGATAIVQEIRSLVAAHDPALKGTIAHALQSGETGRAATESLTLVARR